MKVEIDGDAGGHSRQGPAPAGRRASAPRRHHHGRERPVGDGARADPHRGPPQGGRDGPPDRPPCRRSRARRPTLFSFSTENWRRPADEVSYLMGLLRFFIRRDLAELHGNNVRVRVVGDRNGLGGDIRALLEEAQNLTAGNTGLTLTIAFNYGARQEILRAARRLAEEVAAGRLAPADIDSSSSKPCWIRSACRIPIWSSAPAASSASRTSCSGRRPMPGCLLAGLLAGFRRRNRILLGARRVRGGGNGASAVSRPGHCIDELIRRQDAGARRPSAGANSACASSRPWSWCRLRSARRSGAAPPSAP